MEILRASREGVADNILLGVHVDWAGRNSPLQHEVGSAAQDGGNLYIAGRVLAVSRVGRRVVASARLEWSWRDCVGGFENGFACDRLHHIDVPMSLRIGPLPREEVCHNDSTDAHESGAAHSPRG